MARLTRECVITEKIDGTNAQIEIVRTAEKDPQYRRSMGLPPL